MSYVINHPEMGIYIGSFLGMGIWSKLDAAGQPAAATFDSIEDAEDFMKTWDSGRPDKVSFVPVKADLDGYASIESCCAAGLDAWSADIDLCLA